jgi:hypothetical protein
MNTIQKRFALFLIGCIGTRLLFVYVAKIDDLTYLRYMGYLFLLPAFGFIYIYLTDSRKTGPEVFGDKIWWNDLRPIHGMLYLLFSYNAITGNKCAWIYLLADVIFGLTSFLVYHFIVKGDGYDVLTNDI